MTRALLTAALAIILTAPPAAAQDADAARAAAVAAWLADDDATALPAFAALGREGDVLSALFLRLSARRGPSSPWFIALPLAERKALRVDPMPQAGPDLAPLAAAVEAELGNEPVAALEGYLATGETARARVMIWASLNFEGPAVLARLGEAPAELRPELWQIATMDFVPPEATPLAKALTAEALAAPDGLAKRLFAFSAQHSPAGALMPEPYVATAIALYLGEGMTPRSQPDAARAAEIETILATAPEAAIHRAVCAEDCAGMEPACTRALWSMTGAYYGAISLMPPLQAVVPREAWLASPRARLDLVRQARNEATLPPSPFPAPGVDCATALIAAR